MECHHHGHCVTSYFTLYIIITRSVQDWCFDTQGFFSLWKHDEKLPVCQTGESLSTISHDSVSVCTTDYARRTCCTVYWRGNIVAVCYSHLFTQSHLCFLSTGYESKGIHHQQRWQCRFAETSPTCSSRGMLGDTWRSSSTSPARSRSMYYRTCCQYPPPRYLHRSHHSWQHSLLPVWQQHR